RARLRDGHHRPPGLLHALHLHPPPRCTPMRALPDQRIQEARQAIGDAHLPTLLPAIAALTGDPEVLVDDLIPERPNLLARQGGMDRTQRERAAGLALDALTRHWESGAPPAPTPSEAELTRMVRFAGCGTAPDSGYLALLREELGLDGDGTRADTRAPGWHIETLAPDREFTVAVI